MKNCNKKCHRNEMSLFPEVALADIQIERNDLITLPRMEYDSLIVERALDKMRLDLIGRFYDSDAYISGRTLNLLLGREKPADNAPEGENKGE